jgi:hypothetical protein
MSMNVIVLSWTRKTRKANGSAGFLDFLVHLCTFCWWALADLNRGPKDYESSALTN